jgi:hypothetical protein
VKLKCYLLTLLKIHRPECERCAREKRGFEMRKRLEELGWRVQPEVLNFGDHAERIDVGVLDSGSSEIVRSSIALKARKRIA